MNQNIKLIKSANTDEEYGILIDKEIGKGNFGKVYKAINFKNIHEQLAVKVLSLKNSINRNLIDRQIEILKQLPQHSNLVKIKPFKYFSEDNLYILMDYCNSTLQQELTKQQGKKFSEEHILDIFFQIMKGYKVLYDCKILHQDIKPQNILIKNGIYKLTDFGLAVFYENHQFNSKRQGAIGYIAPEKLIKKVYIGNHKSDIYSLGVVMFEVIMGTHPYLAVENWGSQQSMNLIIQQIKQSKVRTNPSIVGQYSLSFSQFFDKILQMIQKNDNKRLSFEQVWDFVEHSSLFTSLKKSTPKSSYIQQDKVISQQKWIIKQVSEVLIVPLDASDSDEQEIISQHKESRSLKLKSHTEQSIQKLVAYILQKRVVVYYLDRLARRLIVRRMKGISNSVQSKAILHLILYSKGIITQIMSQIQVPKIFDFCQWKCFNQSENKKLIDLILKDSRYLEDTLCDTFIEDKFISKTDFKNIGMSYRTGSKEKQSQLLKKTLIQTARQMSSLLDSSNSSLLITLLLLLKAAEATQEQIKQKAHELQNYNRLLQDKSFDQLIESVLLQCEKRQILVSFDFSD